MDYQLVYDIQKVWYPGWWIFGIGILLFSIGLGLIFFSDKEPLNSPLEQSTQQRIIYPVIACILGSVFIGGGIINRAAFEDLRTAARDGSTETVEGVVEQFVPQSSGHPEETFLVSNRYFAYSSKESNKGFNLTRSRGGPIREGLKVRIVHVNGSIVRLEVAKQAGL